MAKQLSISTLPLLPKRIHLPEYDLARTECGIVHIGPGAFHRAHQAYYTEKALALGGNWRIHGVSMRSATLKSALSAQDNLYTLSINDNNPELHIIGAIKKLSTLCDDRERVLDALVSKQTKIVTLTVTEKGYCLNAQGHLDTEHADIKADLINQETPVSAVGLLVQTLRLRRLAGYADITIISCDNVSDNGTKLQKAVVEFADKIEPDLGQWIIENIAFPCTMVDSITPATDEHFRTDINHNLGVEDNWPIQREAFTQWVIEDKFSGPRPHWDKVGVTFTDDVRFFEKAKLRVLNGTHSTLAYIGLLLGKETVFDAISTTSIRTLIITLLDEEIIPSLNTPANFDVTAYAQDIVKRYENKHIRHLLSQIAWDGSQKIPFRLLDTIRDNLKAKRSITLLCTAIAAWCLFVNRKAQNHETIVDPLDSILRDSAKNCDYEPVSLTRKLLSLDIVFAELSVNENVKATVLAQLQKLSEIQRSNASLTVDSQYDSLLEQLQGTA